MKSPLMTKYAPLTLAEFGDKGVVVQMLMKMRVIHILISGDVGCGKTSLCNTIVREYYGAHYNPITLADNVLVINNLRDQGVSFYRTDVKTFCQTRSTIIHKKKIVVVDDIDTINETGQQVFLSCLDLFKNNIIFLATCRCSNKILENIHSRMFAIHLQPFNRDFLDRLLDRISSAENIHFCPGATDAVISRSHRSIRTLLNHLEKFILLGVPVTVELVRAQCSSVQEGYLQQILDYLRERRLKDAILLVDVVFAAGYSVMDIFDAFFAYIKLCESGLSEEQCYKVIKLLSKYIYIVNHLHEHPIELHFFLSDCADALS